jgi:hypothetical protein
LCTTNVPVIPVGTIQFAERVMDSPGVSVTLTRYCGTKPSLDLQTTLPFHVMKNWSRLGPSRSVSLWFDVFVRVNVM